MDANMSKKITCYGILLLINIQKTVSQSCDENAVQKCPQDLEKTGLLFTDPCLYFSNLESCLFPFRETCANSVTFALVVEDMLTMKSIFCPISSGCDLSAVDRCMKMLDYAKLNISNPDSFPVFCGESNSIYKPFEECYNEAAPPCSEDPNFMASQIESIAFTISMVCLSTDDCNYLEMTTCAADVSKHLQDLPLIPNSDTYNKLCSTSDNFIECMNPMIDTCERQNTEKLPVYQQSKQVFNYVLYNCYYNKEELLLHSTCLDKPTTTEALAKCTFSDAIEDICQVLSDYVDCVYDSVKSACSEEAALTSAIFAEAFGKNSSKESFGATCNFTKYTPKPTSPASDGHSTTAIGIRLSVSTSPTFRPTSMPNTLVPSTLVIDTTTTTPKSAPTSASPSTHEPTTRVPSTSVPSTRIPSTRVPTTRVPSTRKPTTRVPSTRVPTTRVPSTRVPTTHIPTTTIPSTKKPADVLTTPAPQTSRATTIPNTQYPEQSSRMGTTPKHFGGSTKGGIKDISNKASHIQTIHTYLVVTDFILLNIVLKCL